MTTKRDRFKGKTFGPESNLNSSVCSKMIKLENFVDQSSQPSESSVVTAFDKATKLTIGKIDCGNQKQHHMATLL